MYARIRLVYLSVLMLGIAGTAGIMPGQAQPPTKPTVKPPAKPPAKNETKGQGQALGLDGQFGTIYTLKNGFNFEILSARYTLDTYNIDDPVAPGKEEKLLIVPIAIKNVQADDNFFNSGGFMTAVDATGQLLDQKAVAQTSRPGSRDDPTLKPGQGLGQPELHSPYEVVFAVPAKAKIVKLIVNQGRKGKTEDVVRYYVAGATKEEAGEAGDPKNAIAPLPIAVRASADPSGIMPAEVTKGTLGTPFESGRFVLRLDSFAYTTDAVVGDAPEDGKRYAVATLTATARCVGDPAINDVEDDNVCVADADGNTEKPRYLKAHGTDDLDGNQIVKTGSSYTFREVFTVPKDVAQKTLTLSCQNGRVWEFDVSGVK